MLRISLLALLGCELTTDKETNEVDGASDTSNPDTNDTAPPWISTGEGVAYFLDGTEANSLFTLELNNASPPPEGDGFIAYLMNSSGGELYIGPMPVSDSSLFWQSETGINALVENYNGIQIRLSSDDSIVYSGVVDPTVENTYRNLLLSSPDTPNGNGSLREIQQTLELLIAHNISTIAITGDMPAIHQGAEATVNTILGNNVDYNNDTLISVLPDTMPLIGEDLADTDDLSNLRNLVLADLDAASLAAHQIAPTHFIKDLANYAYDCTQLVGSYAKQAAQTADNVAAGIVDEADCDARLSESNVFLGYASSGYDTDESGSIEDLTEGTINCAIFYVSQMAYMEVGLY